MSLRLLITLSLWAVVGLGLAAWAIRGLLVESHFKIVLVSWLIVLAYGALALLGWGLSVRLHPAGRYLLGTTSVVGVLYGSAYFIFGGVQDASRQIPYVIAVFLLSAYTLICFPQLKGHAS